MTSITQREFQARNDWNLCDKMKIGYKGLTSILLTCVTAYGCASDSKNNLTSDQARPSKQISNEGSALGPEDAKRLLAQGDDLINSKKDDQAYWFYYSASIVDPNSAGAYYRIAQVSVRNEWSSVGMRAVKRLEQLRPDSTNDPSIQAMKEKFKIETDRGEYEYHMPPGEALMCVGELYDKGEFGVAEDQVESIKWYREAAARGNTTAMHRLAAAYLDGTHGLRIDYAEALKWNSNGANLGDHYCMASLSIQYLQGKGVNVNYNIGVGYLQKAAEKGNVPAAALLGSFYEHGEVGLPMNRVEAIRWYRVAANGFGEPESSAIAKEAIQRLGQGN